MEKFGHVLLVFPLAWPLQQVALWVFNDLSAPLARFVGFVVACGLALGAYRRRGERLAYLTAGVLAYCLVFLVLAMWPDTSGPTDAYDQRTQRFEAELEAGR